MTRIADPIHKAQCRTRQPRIRQVVLDQQPAPRNPRALAQENHRIGSMMKDIDEQSQVDALWLVRNMLTIKSTDRDGRLWPHQHINTGNRNIGTELLDERAEQ